MSTGREISTQVISLVLFGICLFGIAFFAPDSGDHFGAFLKIAKSSSWQQPFEGMAAWCSLKLILISVGLMLVIESSGTILVWLKRKKMAAAVFSLHFMSLLFFIIAAYYLLRAVF